ncbi:MAG: hypothetical protein WA354_20665 [Terracidiphilus sp.]
MSTLVIHAPSKKTQQENKRSFHQTFESGVGDNYAISKNLFYRLSAGCNVILLDKWKDLRAEGTLVRLEKTEKAGNGLQRYDVQIENLRMVPYKPENLNRNGVAVITQV